MSASSDYETALLQEIFNQIAVPDMTADLYLALHTGVLSDDSKQDTNEAAYTGYTRIALERVGGNWVVALDQVSNVNDVEFGECSVGSESISYFSVGRNAAGAGMVLFWGQLDSPIAISPGVTPRFKAGTLVVSVD